MIYDGNPPKWLWIAMLTVALIVVVAAIGAILDPL